MPDTGIDVANAITRHAVLRGLANCPAVPIQMGYAIYASLQGDKGNLQIKHDTSQKEIDSIIAFSGSPSDTAVWHFGSSSPVHHFVVMPWYQYTAPVGFVYTVFMAYENKYNLGEYIDGAGNFAPTGALGYKTAWTFDELKTMLHDLVTSNTAWEDYFGHVGPARTMTLTCNKYNTARISTAMVNLRRYTRIR